MKLLQFAVASIVDANTGYGFVQGAGNDYSAAEKHGRSIRARSVIALLVQIRERIAGAVASYRAHAAQKRQLAILANLNDHALKDIGLSRGDITAVELGQLTFAKLEAERRINQSAMASSDAALAPIDLTDSATRAVNEAIFTRAKCA